MPSLKLIVAVLLGFALGSAFAAESAPVKKDARAERPQREAVKLSPKVRTSEPRPDESDKMRRVAPPRGESPLQHVPALKDPPPTPPPGQLPVKP